MIPIPTLEAVSPVVIGPTWQRNSDGSFLMPDLSLGWHIAAWVKTHLLLDNGGPWRFTNEQIRFVMHWYALDQQLRFRYRDGVLQRLKGWG